MFDAKVPTTWRKVSWESSTIGFWFTELLERNMQLSKWVFEGAAVIFQYPGHFHFFDTASPESLAYRVYAQKGQRHANRTILISAAVIIRVLNP